MVTKKRRCGSKSKGKSCKGRRKTNKSKAIYKRCIPTPVPNTLATYGWGMRIQDDRSSSGLTPIPRSRLKTTMASYSPRFNGIY